MKVWIVNPFDNLPLEGNRPQRYWLMSRAFARAGHAVTFWTSDFSHAHKAPRVFLPEQIAKLNAGRAENGLWTVDGFRLGLVPTPAYRRNICPSRLWSHRVLARRWRALAAAEETPDVVIASSPPLGLCAAARDYCAAKGIPFVVDVMDAWPETFERVVPKFFLKPLARVARTNYRSAAAISVVAARYRELAVAAGATAPVALFYHGIARQPAAPIPETRPANDRFTLVYAGTMGASYDLETLIEAVKSQPDVALELAGTGPKEPALRTLAADCSNIRFHGYLDEVPLRALLARGDAAVVPMFPDSCVGVPYKLADYAAAGLPVLNSLTGETADLLAQHQAGVSYTAGDAVSLVAALAELRAGECSVYRAGAARLADLFDADTVYGGYVDWIRALVDGRR